jgi:hypothetical protein
MAAFALRHLLRCTAASYLSGIGRKGDSAMFEQVKKFVRAFHLPSVEELEREYLNGAANRVDLEFRQRQVDRGMFRNMGM